MNSQEYILEKIAEELGFFQTGKVLSRAQAENEDGTFNKLTTSKDYRKKTNAVENAGKQILYQLAGLPVGAAAGYGLAKVLKLKEIPMAAATLGGAVIASSAAGLPPALDTQRKAVKYFKDKGIDTRTTMFGGMRVTDMTPEAKEKYLKKEAQSAGRLAAAYAKRMEKVYSGTRANTELASKTYQQAKNILGGAKNQQAKLDTLTALSNGVGDAKIHSFNKHVGIADLNSAFRQVR